MSIHTKIPHKHGRGRVSLRSRAMALVLLLPVSSAGCGAIGTQFARNRVRREVAWRADLELEGAEKAVSEGRLQVGRRYKVERSEPSADTWTLATLGTLVDLLGGSLAFFLVAPWGEAPHLGETVSAERQARGTAAGLLAWWVLGSLIVDPLALVAAGIDDDWELVDVPPGPAPAAAATRDGRAIAAQRPPRRQADVEVVPRERALAEPVSRERAPFEVVARERAPAEVASRERAAVEAVALEIFPREASRAVSCPLPAPLPQHHRVDAAGGQPVRTGRVLTGPGGAFSVSSVRATRFTTQADEVVFEVAADGRSDVVLRLDVAIGCLRGPGNNGRLIEALSVVVADAQGRAVAGGEVAAPTAEKVRHEYQTVTIPVVLGKERLSAGRHTLLLRVTGGREGAVGLVLPSTGDEKTAEYFVAVRRVHGSLADR